ncbi:MAG: esterase family protein, partial [Terracidiphilus sp.]
MPNSGPVFPLLAAFVVAATIAPFAQAQASAGPAALISCPRGPRPAPPTRDPHSPGYVAATELPDGAIPAPSENGNFIIGPTHTPAPELADQNRQLEGTVVEFTMNSEDSKYFPGIACNQDSQPAPDPENPARLVGIMTHPQSYVRKVAVYVPKNYVPGSEAPFIVGADGPDRMLIQALDGLIAEH